LTDFNCDAETIDLGRSLNGGPEAICGTELFVVILCNPKSS